MKSQENHNIITRNIYLQLQYVRCPLDLHRSDVSSIRQLLEEDMFVQLWAAQNLLASRETAHRIARCLAHPQHPGSRAHCGVVLHRALYCGGRFDRFAREQPICNSFLGNNDILQLAR